MALQTVPVVQLPSAWLRPCSLPLLGTALVMGSLSDEAHAQNGWKWFGKSPTPVTQPGAPRNGFSVSVERLMNQARQEANAGQLDQAIKTAQRAHKISEAAAGVLGTDPACSPAMTRQFLNDMVALQEAANGLPAAALAQVPVSAPAVRPSVPSQPSSHVVIPRTPQPAVAAASPAQTPSSAVPAPPPVSLRKTRPAISPAASTTAVVALPPAVAAPAAVQPSAPKIAASPTAPITPPPVVASKSTAAIQQPEVAAQEALPPWEGPDSLIGLNEFSITGGESSTKPVNELQGRGATQDLTPFTVLESESAPKPAVASSTREQAPLETLQADQPESIVVDLGPPQSSFDIVGNNEVFRPLARSARPAAPTRVEWSSKAPAVAVRISPSLEETVADSALPEWDDGEAAVNSFAQSATAPLLDFNEEHTLSSAESESLPTTLDELSMMIVDLPASASDSLNTAALLPLEPELSKGQMSARSAPPAASTSASPVFVMSLSPVDEIPTQKIETTAKDAGPGSTASVAVVSSSPVIPAVPVTSLPVATAPVNAPGVPSDVPQTAVAVAPVTVMANAPAKEPVVEKAPSQITQKQSIQKPESSAVAVDAIPVVKDAQPLAKTAPVPLETEITTLSAVEKGSPAAVITPAVDRGRPGVLVPEEDLPVMPAPTEWSSPSSKRGTSPAKRTQWVDPSWSPAGAATSQDQGGKAAAPGTATPEAAPSSSQQKTTSAHNEQEVTQVALATHAVAPTAPHTHEITLVAATSLDLPVTAPAPPVAVMDEVLTGPAVWMREDVVKHSVETLSQSSATYLGPMERAAQQYGMSLPVAPWLAGAMGFMGLLTGYFWMRRFTSERESAR